MVIFKLVIIAQEMMPVVKITLALTVKILCVTIKVIKDKAHIQIEIVDKELMDESKIVLFMQ